MAKNKKTSKKPTTEMTAEQIVQFIEDMRQLAGHRDEPTEAISLRVPANILRAVKSKAQQEKRKYQSIIIEYIRQGLIKK